MDFIQRDQNGRGMINVLDSQSLISNGALYSIFLLYLLAELFETLPEVGDLDKPKLVFFFDEAHLLFDGASKALMEKIEQVIKLIRSKGVGIYFVTQNPRDIPDEVLAQLGNKVQHGLRAYTPAEQKAVRAAAQSYRENPSFDTQEAILSLGTGEAVISMLGDDGIPTIVEKCCVLPPRSKMGSIDSAVRDKEIKNNFLYSKYANPVDNDSAYEFLQRKGIEDQKAAEKAAADAAAEKEAAAEAKKKAKEEEAAAKKAANSKKKAVKSVTTSVGGTVGREVGKAVGGTFGKFGKTLGGNVGASLGRGILNTLFKLN